MNTEQTVIVESDGPITRLSVNRPQALNALNPQTVEALIAAVDDLRAGTRVLILTGAGDRSFIAGADIGAMAELSPLQAVAFARMGHSLGERLAALDAVVIAEVNGFALGGGCELMLACDFAVASDKAKIGQPEVGLGVTPGFGGTTRLVRRVGVSVACRMVTTAEQLDAQQALAWGLVSEVVPADELRARVDKLASKIARNAPWAVAASKRSVHIASETDLATANAYEQQAFGLCFSTADQSEGMKAFVEKRKPQWTGS